MEIIQEQNVYGQIVQKAWENTQFKKELIADPIATIEEFTGKKANVPEGQKFVVLDQSDESIVYFNIPRDPRNTELTEDQLETVAGGADERPLNFGEWVGAEAHKLYNAIFN